jgi:thiol-disulfide isomerase/thioredoxin
MKEITTQELKELQSQGKKMLVDIKAVWCGPCKELIPRLEIIEKDFQENFDRYYKISKLFTFEISLAFEAMTRKIQLYQDYKGW